MFKKYISLSFLAVLIMACSGSSNNGPSGGGDNFDRSTLLTNVANNIIIPAFQDLNQKLATLKTDATAFTNTPTTATLATVRTSWYNAYKTWQHVSMFDIGKAEELQFVNHFNIYPVTVADVESNVTSGTYNFDSPNNHDAQGFPALDYLFYGVGNDDTAILAKFTTDAKANGYKKYVNDIVAKMNTVATTILNDWNGAYKNDFINSTANTATSSLNKLVNDYIFYYEKRLRANKIGIPAGVFSSTSLPDRVEAFYRKNISRELAVEGLTSVQNFFEGRAYKGTSTGASFKSYLVSLNRQDLADKITNQLAAAKTKLNQLNVSLYQQVKSDNTQMTLTYDELQKAVVLLKVDMLQAFNVVVDFVDADGD